MKITALEEYGLRCLLRLAMAPGGEPVTVGEIAEKEGLTVPHVGKLMSVLLKTGLVESVRGRSGGYVLARPASEISVEEVLGALGEPLFASNYCESHPGSLDVCSNQGNCSIRSVWQVLGEIIHQVLRGTSLADLCLQEERLASHFKHALEPALLHLGSGTSGGSSISGGASSPGSE
jgi:Rrf2 family protein